MDARNAILGKIRGALNVTPHDGDRQAAVAARLRDHAPGIIPARGQLPAEQRIALFIAMAEKYSATCVRIPEAGDVPGEVSHYLRSRNLPSDIRMGADPLLATLPWSNEPTLTVKPGASDGLDLAGVSRAFGAIAETGTLALTSGADNPTTINFLPEHHIVVVDAKDVLGDMEAVLARLRRTYGPGEMPRALNFVTGPSRSADIEQTLLLGAHGPKALHIIVLGRAED